MEAFTGLRSQGGVLVTHGSGLKKNISRLPVSPKGVLLIVLLELFKFSKITNFNYDLFKVSKFCLVLMHMYIFLWCFFMVKNCYKFSKMSMQGNA